MGDNGPQHGTSYNHSFNFYTWNGYTEAPGASGLWYTEIGNSRYSLKTDPVHPVFIARLASDTPVSDLVCLGTRLYVAEGSANGFSLWDVSAPTAPTRLSRWPSQGFANSIWPR